MMKKGKAIMKKRLWVACALLLSARAVFAQSGAAPRALLDQYCVTCHNEKTRTGKLSLEKMDVTRVGENAAIWEKVVRKVRAGMMPPTGPLGARRPDRATLNAFVAGLETELDRAAA